MEKKFLHIFDVKNSGMRVVNLSEKINLLELPCNNKDHCCHEDGLDRHFWMSPAVVKTQLASIAEALQHLLPENASLYQANFAAANEEIAKLDQEIRDRFSQKPPRAIAISHPALGYFCRDYGIEQLSIEIFGKEPLPGDVANLMKEFAEKKVASILLLPQHNNLGATRIAEALHLPTRMIDPYSPDYPAALRSAAEAIAYE